jgi:excinuclease UvrABC nuclease subunit
MYEASKNLKFEQAGRYRDQLHQLKGQFMSR